MSAVSPSTKERPWLMPETDTSVHEGGSCTLQAAQHCNLLLEVLMEGFVICNTHGHTECTCCRRQRNLRPWHCSCSRQSPQLLQVNVLCYQLHHALLVNASLMVVHESWQEAARCYAGFCCCPGGGARATAITITAVNLQDNERANVRYQAK